MGESELPENFGDIVKGIYRSSFPEPSNFPALKALGLRTIMYVALGCPLLKS